MTIVPPEHDQNKYPQKLGGTMTLLAWILFMGILTLLFSNYLDRQANPNPRIASRTDGANIEVMLDRNRSGHYVATALLNGLAVEVMIDTGATDVSVPTSIADQAGLRPGPAVEVSTANGIITVHATVIDTIQLGDLVLQDVRANINPSMEENVVLLGMSFLKRIDFSQQQGQLVLRQQGSL